VHTCGAILGLLHNNKLIEAEFTKLQLKSKVVVVSVFGESHLNSYCSVKRAFQLAVDSFGSLELFQDEEDASAHSSTSSQLIVGVYALVSLTLTHDISQIMWANFSDAILNHRKCKSD